MTILSADNNEENLVIQINKQGIEDDKLKPPKCDSGEPSDDEMDYEKLEDKPTAKGKPEMKSRVNKLDRSVKKEAGF